MIITPSKVSIKLPASDTPRSKGVHASGIIRNIAIEMGILKEQEEFNLYDKSEITDELAILRMSIGLAWEAHYINNVLYHEGVVKHPGEMQLSDIGMNPDGESVETVKGKTVLVIHEVKATYKSTRTVGDVTNQWMYLTQLKCYCKAAKTRWGKLHVLFLCGDYSYPIRPVARAWVIEFTQKELDSNWDLMVDYKNQRS